MRKSSLVMVTLLAVFILIAGCTKPGERNILKVGDWTMSVDMFREILRNQFGEDGMKKVTDAQIDKKLNDLIAQRLVTEAAYKDSLDTLDYARTTYDRMLNERAMQALQTQVVLDKVLNEKMLKDFYKHDKYEVRVFHILIKDRDERSSDEAERLADSLYHVAIQPKVDFIQLARKYNEDKTTPAGDIGWFGWGAMVPEFENKVWSMKVNEISEPVHTSYGWHIIKLAGRREKKNRPSYALDKNRIRSRLMELHGGELRDKSLAFIDSLKKAHHVSINQEAVDAMVAKIAATGDYAHSPDPFRRFTEKNLSSVLVTFDLPPESLTVQDVSDYVNKFVRPQDRFLTKETVDRQLDIIISQLYLMPDEIKKRGLLKEPEVIHGAREAVDYYLFTYYKDQRKENLPAPTEAEMRDYYQKNIRKYTAPKRYEGIEILVDQPAEARKLYLRVKAGASIEELAAKYTVRANGRNRKGHLGPFNEGTFGPLSDALADAKEGDVVGPVDLRGGYSVFKLTKIYPPSPQKFDVARPKVVRDIQDMRAKADYEALVDSLMQNASYKIYRKNLKYVLDQRD